MKRKILSLLLIIIFLFIALFNNYSFAAYADMTDEIAEEENKKAIEKQEKELENVSQKSTNNYLKKLNVEGYVFSPNFDKQTIDYIISGETNDNKVKIVAEAEDSKAKVSGIGEREIHTGENILEVEVAAESGTVRTYRIKINKKVANENLKLNTLTLKTDLGKELDISPNFTSNNYSYKTEVENEVKNIEINYTSNENAKVEIAGNTNLKDGENIITIKVIANDGTESTTYRVNVIRKSGILAKAEGKEDKKELDAKAIIAIIVVFLLLAFLLRGSKKKGKKRKRK